MILSASNALITLFNHSRDSLPKDKLEWFSNLGESAICESNNLASTLGLLAMMHSSSDKSSLPTESQLSEVLFLLSSQAEIISALVSVSSESASLLQESNVKSSDIKKPI